MKVARFTTRGQEWRRRRDRIDAALDVIEHRLAAVRRMLRGFDTAVECEEQYGPPPDPSWALSTRGVTTWLDQIERELTAAHGALPPTPGYDKP